MDRKFITATSILSIFLILLWSCKDPEYFPEFKGVNLIEDRGFDAVESDGITLLWKNHPDMSFLPAIPGTTVGLPDPSAPVYAVEIPNLAANGDFESAGYGPWSFDGAGAGSATQNLIPGIDGNSFHFQYNSANTFIKAAFGGLTAGKSYTIYLELRNLNNSSTNFIFRFEASSWELTLASGDTLGFEATFIAGGSSGDFTIESDHPEQQEGYIDNVKFCRADLANRIVLEVPYRDTGRPDLISGGSYTFSFYVLGASKPSTLEQTNKISLGINKAGILQLTGPSQNLIFSDSSWTRVCLTANPTITLPEDPDDAVLLLHLTPSDLSSLTSTRPGSILVSTPSLTWSPDL